MLAPRDVQTTINYQVHVDDDITYAYTKVSGEQSHNVQIHPHSVVVHDARGKPTNAFGLDVSGFEWVEYPSEEKAFVDEEKIKTVYYPEVEDILKKYAAGAKSIFIFEHKIRRAQADQTAQEDSPAHHVHVDQSPKGAELRLRHEFPDEAGRLLKDRYRIINVWRPIENAVANNALGVADIRSVDLDADPVPLSLTYPHRKGEAFSFKYNPGHKWYYLSDQTPDEVTLIKCFDSDLNKAQFAPHSAFLDKTRPLNAPLRQSIEECHHDPIRTGQIANAIISSIDHKSLLIRAYIIDPVTRSSGYDQVRMLDKETIYVFPGMTRLATQFLGSI